MTSETQKFDTQKFIREVEKRVALYDADWKKYCSTEEKKLLWREVGSAMLPGWDTLLEEDKSRKVKVLMTKWKSCRDNFVKDHKKREKQQPWRRYVHYDQLRFLIPYLTTSTLPRPFENVSTLENNVEDHYGSEEGHSLPGKSSETEEENDINQFTESTSQPTNIQPTEREDDDQLMQISENSYGRQSVEQDHVNQPIQITEVTGRTTQWMKQDEDRNVDKYGNRAFMLSFVPIMDNLPEHLFLHARTKISEVIQQVTFAKARSPPSVNFRL